MWQLIFNIFLIKTLPPKKYLLYIHKKMTTAPLAQPMCEHFIVYDTQQWPLVHCTVKAASSNLTLDHFRAHLSCFEELLLRNQPFHILFDLRDASLIPLEYVQEQAQFMETQQPHIRRNLISSAIISDSWLIRGGLEILFAIKKPTRPNKTFSDPAEAIAWMQTVTLDHSADVEKPKKKFFFE